MELEYCVSVSNKYSLFLQDEEQDPLELIEKKLKGAVDKDGSDKSRRKDKKGAAAPVKSGAAVGGGSLQAAKSTGASPTSTASAKKAQSLSEAPESKDFKHDDKENKSSKLGDASRNAAVRRPFRPSEKEAVESRRSVPSRDRFRQDRGNLPPRLGGGVHNEDGSLPPVEDRFGARFGEFSRGFNRGRGRGRGFGRGRGSTDRFANSSDHFGAGGGAATNVYAENDAEEKPYVPTFNTFGITNEENGEVQEGGGANFPSKGFRGEFGGRGSRGGRGRGGFRGGRGMPFRGRQFDRQSGSDRSGVKPTDKREGAGAYNWGFPGDELYGSSEANVGTEELNPEKEDSNKMEEQESGGEGVEDSEGHKEAQRELTLDEWKALQGPRTKPNFNIRKPGEGESNAEWKKLVPLKRDTQDDKEQFEEELDDEEEMEDDDRHRKKPVVSIEIKFIDEPSRAGRGGRGGRPSGRAGRGGRGELGGRRTFGRGGSGNVGGGFSAGPPAPGSAGASGRREAPYKMDDESFPQLTPTVA